MSFPWTPQQVALYDRLEFTNDSIIVRAVAGSGKTTSLGECSHKIDNTLVAAALAFNVRSKKDLERIFNEKVQCLTINGLGHRAMCKYLGARRPEIDKNKMYKITREVINEYDAQELWSPVHSLATKAKTHGLVPSKASGQFKALMDDSYESWEELATHYDINFSHEICELAREVLIKSIQWSFQDKRCDFDDQVYICQPPGTRVLMEKGSWSRAKAIEDIEVGDKVISYNRRISKLVGFYNHASEVNAVRKLHYSGLMYSIQTTDTNAEATAAHKWLVKLEKKQQMWTVYLMKKGNSWRIGQSVLWRKSGGNDKVPHLGALNRARTEYADSVWILTTANSLREAKIMESTLSAAFGISPHLFSDEHLGTQVHSALGDVTEKAHKLLHSYGRHELLPLWPEAPEVRESGKIVGQTQLNFRYPCLVRSCNLMSEFMLIPEVYGKEIEWVEFRTSRREYTGPVYSIQVHRNHLYVADGLLTHNSTCWPASFDQRDVLFVDEAQDLSAIQHKMLKKALRRGGRMIAVGDENQAIYGFRGSLSNSISLLKEAFNLQPMGLTTSFRCAKSIVREAQKIVPDIEAFNGAPEGSVEHVDEFDHSIFKYGDVILCRNNGPLIKMAYRLIMEGVGVHVLGRDIGSGLVNLVKRLMGEEFYGSIEELHQKLDNWEEIEVRRATGKEEWSKVASLNDKADSLRSVIEFSGAESLKALCQSIKDLFGRTSAPILLSSIHKAKGSEWDRVYFLDSDLIPSRWAIKANDRNPELFSWMMEQEQNLRYVGVTRAKSELVYINGNGWSRE